MSKLEIKNIPFSPPDISDLEIEAVVKAMKSGWITTGPETKAFEKELSTYFGTNKTVCFNSATAAMELTLRLLGIGEGDEVIVPAYTYTASCSVICHVGAKPVIVDVNHDSFYFNYDTLGEYISDKTKAIIPVDLGGTVCDYDKLYEIVESKKHLFTAKTELQEALGRIAIISDCAHAIGAKYKGIMCGGVSDFSCFSFHAVKNLTTAEGGCVTWRNNQAFDDEMIYKQYQILSLHGQTKDALSKSNIGSWEYDILLPGYKANMIDLVASIGRVQLSRYDDLLRRRREIVRMYDVALAKLNVQTLSHCTQNFDSSCHLYLVRINGINEKERNKVILNLAERGISTNVHYKPLPMLTAYKNLGYEIKDFPNAYHQYENEITLPLYSTLSNEDVNYIIDAFTEIVRCY